MAASTVHVGTLEEAHLPLRNVLAVALGNIRDGGIQFRGQGPSWPALQACGRWAI